MIEFGSSIEGMMHAQKQMDFASQQIATKTITDQMDQDITRDIADQKVAKFSFQANARVAKVQDKMLGEVIDLLG